MLSEKIVDVLEENHILPKEDRAIYEYGFRSLMFASINLLTDVAIGLLFGRLPESLLFLAFYISLRKFAGGYHAISQIRCYGLSTGLLLAALALFTIIQRLENVNAVITIVFGCAALTILCLAPVDTSNKKLDVSERSMFRKWSLTILAVHGSVFGIALLQRYTLLAVSISVSDILLAFMLILGVIKRVGSTENPS